MSPEVARRVVHLFREIRPPARGVCHLTPQETELLKLLVEGHHYKTAADVMGISVNTVSFHLENVLPFPLFFLDAKVCESKTFCASTTYGSM